MFCGLPGGSPGPNAQFTCLTASILIAVALVVVTALVGLLFWVTSQIQ